LALGWIGSFGIQLMPKIMTIIGLVMAGLIVLLFALDLAAGIPFGRASMLMDITFVLCGLVLAYLSWTTMREQV
jgi:uncharacterized membrane protein YuzA (DUF378 family)